MANQTYKELNDITGYTVADYLAHRLEQLGVRHMFGVPGNHLGPFLSIMQDVSKIRWRGNTNEINGGYAADGYARVKGISAVGVTYGVGALSLINTVGGAFVEHVPMVVVNAAPTFEQHLNYQAIGLLTSHMSPFKQSNLEAYRQVTVDAQRITNSHLAPMQIDAALAMCITEQRPIYLEVFQDVWTERCREPEGEIVPCPRDPNTKNVKKAVEATMKMIENHDDLPILWGGMEINRKKLGSAFEQLVNETGIPYCTSIMGKSIISERNPRFHGIYNGNASEKWTYRIFNCGAKCRIGIGGWTTSKNLGGTKNLGEDWSNADHEGVRVGSKYFPNVDLGMYIDELRKALVDKYGKGHFKDIDYYTLHLQAAAERADTGNLLPKRSRSTKKEDIYKELKFHFPDLPVSKEDFFEMLAETGEDPDEKLTYDLFFNTINDFIGQADTTKEVNGKTIYENPYGIVADAGFSLLGSQNIKMSVPNTFFSQTSWLSIGYSVGSATGLKTALSENDDTDRRMMVFVGDGSFQETCQAMSSHTRHKQNNIVFIMNNEDFYGIEQMLVDSRFYVEKESCKIDADFYNELQPWNYTKLAEVFGNSNTKMHGHIINNYGELQTLLERFNNPEDDINDGPNIVQLRLPRLDYPSSIGYKVEVACGEELPHICDDLADEIKKMLSPESKS